MSSPLEPMLQLDSIKYQTHTLLKAVFSEFLWFFSLYMPKIVALTLHLNSPLEEMLQVCYIELDATMLHCLDV